MNAIALKGIPWTTQQRRGTAVHEAAHAVAALVTGVPVYGVLLNVVTDAGAEDGNSGFAKTALGVNIWGNCVYYHAPGDRWPSDAPGCNAAGTWPNAVVHLSGPAAQTRATKGVLPSTRDDMKLHLSDVLRAGLDIDRAARDAKALVWRHWKAITALAAALEQRDALDEDGVLAIVSPFIRKAS